MVEKISHATTIGKGIKFECIIKSGITIKIGYQNAVLKCGIKMGY